MSKTETKTETLNRLFTENGLLPEDVHKHNHYTIITRPGIEKIQAKNKVSVHYEAVVMERDFAVVKGTFSKEGVPNLQTFGSASKETCQNRYYAEMAEKRCLSRGVLKICKFYELGVYGEDEADDFKPPQRTQTVKAGEGQPKQGNASQTAPKAPASESTTRSLPGKALEVETPMGAFPLATDAQRQEIRTLLEDGTITRQEKTKMMLSLNVFDTHRATEAIAKIKWVIAERKRIPVAK